MEDLQEDGVILDHGPHGRETMVERPYSFSQMADGEAEASCRREAGMHPFSPQGPETGPPAGIQMF